MTAFEDELEIFRAEKEAAQQYFITRGQKFRDSGDLQPKPDAITSHPPGVV